MQTDKFTALVRNAMIAAQNDALAADHQRLTALHVLSTILADDNVMARNLVRCLSAWSSRISVSHLAPACTSIVRHPRPLANGSHSEY